MSYKRKNTCIVCGTVFERSKVTLCCSPECRHAHVMECKIRNGWKPHEPRKKKKKKDNEIQDKKMFECPFSNGTLGDEIGEMNYL